MGKKSKKEKQVKTSRPEGAGAGQIVRVGEKAKCTLCKNWIPLLQSTVILPRLLAKNEESSEITKFAAPWSKCSICVQEYQHELAIELSNSLPMHQL